MLTCIACSKHLAGGTLPLHKPLEDEDAVVAGGANGSTTPRTRQAIKALTAQIKDIALKASGMYRHYEPCAGSSAAASRRHHPYHHGCAYADSEVGSGFECFHYTYWRAGSSSASTLRLRSGSAMSRGDATLSVSMRTDFLTGNEEDGEKETAAGGSENDKAKE